MEKFSVTNNKKVEESGKDCWFLKGEYAMKPLLALLLVISLTSCSEITVDDTGVSSSSVNSTLISGNTTFASGQLASPAKIDRVHLLSKHITVHALDKLKSTKSCSPVLTMRVGSRKGYRDVMTMARNRAYTAGANALAVTDWKEASSRTHLTVHAFDCSNLKGKSCKKSICISKPS